MGGMCSFLASCLALGVQHWSLLVFEWSCVLVLRWRSLGELLLIDIMWGWEVSGGPISWIWLSHLRGSVLAAGWSTKTLSATRLEKMGYKLVVSHCPIVALSQLSPKVTQIHWVIPPFFRPYTFQSGICRCPPHTLHWNTLYSLWWEIW